ncbi:37280_t:CDS:2, partial [Gigaspora margarita]
MPAILGSSDQRAAATTAQNVTTTNNSQFKIATLTAIGFVCKPI